MLGIDRITHVKGAILPDTNAVLGGWVLREPEDNTIEEADLPTLDDKYIFIERVRVPPMPLSAEEGRRFMAVGHEIVAIWAIGFASIRVGVKMDGATPGIGSLERPRKKAFVLAFWPVLLADNWQEKVRALEASQHASAVVPLTPELGMALHLYDPNITIALADTFFARTLLF